MRSNIKLERFVGSGTSRERSRRAANANLAPAIGGLALPE